MRDAIIENNWKALEILIIVGPDLDLNGFKDLCRHGHDSIVRTLFDWLRSGGVLSSVYWDDPELRNWVRNKKRKV